MPHIDRSWRADKSLQSEKEGNITKSKRLFGVEIECYSSGDDDLDAVAAKCDKNIGFGGDGSINSYNGVEFRLPPMSGDTGEAALLDLTKLLNENNFDVDSSCGLHVHIDAQDMRDKIFKNGKETVDGWKFLQTYWMFYIVFDNVVRSFLPMSRRRNSYCMPCELVYGAVRNAKSFTDLREIYGSRDEKLLDKASRIKYKDPTRYRGLNLFPLFEGWHAEVRYHNGTIQGDRIMHWSYLHCAIMDRVLDGTITQEAIENARRRIGIFSKTEAFFNLVQVAEPTQAYLRARQIKFSQELAKLLTAGVLEQVELLAESASK